MESPSQEEQIIAEDYVLNRPLIRPDTDIKKAIICVVIYLLSSLIIGFLLLYTFSRLGIFALFPDFICNFKKNHNIWFTVLFILAIYFITGLLCLKKAIIGCIKLYQHYAPEQIRRRCLFKPTCSEYAILTIKKYGVIIGLIKTRRRLFKGCKGNIYRIDYPQLRKKRYY